MPEQTAMSGNELARQRRAMMSRVGKPNANGKPGAKPGSKPDGKPDGKAGAKADTKPNIGTVAASPAAPVDTTHTLPTGGTRSGATGAGNSSAVSQGSGRLAATPATPEWAESTLDELCSLVEDGSDPTDAEAGSVRALCRQRRQALASRGKGALPAPARVAPGSSQRGRESRGKLPAIAAGGSGRDLAQQRRAALARSGRGDAEPARPSGRIRPTGTDAPPKVEIGTTLSGRTVTGTQVERKGRVSGNEAGSCRVVTGTEYIGTEQFESFCESRPTAGPAKIGASTTGAGQRISGSEVGRSIPVTGDEAGSCSLITGTEYLGRERLAEFCASDASTPRPEKVAVGISQRKGLAITGSDEARGGRITGTEPGAARSITGSQYADAGAARFTINGPSKVALTHTIAGRPVSGTEVGRSIRVTGDEAGSCRQVSGTEYLSNEQFSSVCQTRPQPGPEKVGVDASRDGQRITGNLIDRSERITGNEPGSCQRVTGSQYGSTRICGGGVEKVGASHTVRGSTITGTEFGRRPQMTGDERGGCLPVTGNEMLGLEQYAAVCPDTVPPRSAGKVGRSETPRGMPVSGTMMGRSGLVTGNEPGSGFAVSGTPYAGREQTDSACGCGCGCCPAAMSRTRTPVPAATDFSIIPPSRQALEIRSRITGSDNHSGLGRITGPINLATGLVSGTPEFRHPDNGAAMAEPAPAAPEAVAPTRITGEGRDDGIRITGDDWARSGRVTGTEGKWAQGRNVTLRGEARSGEARGAAAGAWANKGRERVETPPARITGSAGNAGKGAVITVSGGARG